MNSHDINSLRKQLLANNYLIIPNNGKIPAVKGWNTPEFVQREMSPERIETWPDRFEAPTTGLLVRDGICVIDVDVDDPLIDALFSEILRIAPGLKAAPTRYGGGEYKNAMFCRTKDRFVRVASKKYNGHAVEIFGGAPLKNGHCSRQFGIYGPHSAEFDYVWCNDIPDLLQVRREDLPLLTRAQALAILAAFEQLAEAQGWVAEEAPKTDAASAVYDIEADTRFDTDKGGHGLDYAELSAACEAQGNLRCASSFIKGRSGRKTERCWVFFSKRHDCIAVYVYGDETTHYPAEYAPKPDAVLEAFKTAETATSAPDRPDDSASISDKALWLGQCYGYCALSDSVVEVWKAADDCLLKPPAFQRLYRAWRETVAGKKGGVKYSYASAYWEVNPARLDLEGVRMRPDKLFPVYTEKGRLFKNTYLRPRHEGSGDIAPWIEYMAHLLPDRTEREWFCNWLAHKHRNPGIPGVAVVMVAAGAEGPVYGAGRGILRDIISRLLGPRYVKPVDFDVFTGKSSQGIYTDWGAYATLITVNEAKDTPDAGMWRERRAVYERLREIVDPRAIERTFIRKGYQSFTSLSFASYLVFSNNRDALQIPDGDRRVAALANGEQMSEKMAEGLQKWMDQPGNIAELARWLESRDLSQFNVYQPPITETKIIMQELARSELDEAFDLIRRRIGPQRLFTGEQIRSAILMELGDVMSPDIVKNWVTRRLRAEATQVGTYKMTPTEGRHKILSWRGWARKWQGDSSAAQAAVHKTAEILADRSSVTVTWPVSPR